MAKELTNIERSAMEVSYEVNGSTVNLDMDFVKRYLVSGDASRVTDQELMFYINTCKAQKLNPLVSGESYLIKYGDRPAQTIVGKTAILKRAFKNPNYMYKKDGIVVERGNEFVRKPGCAVYPGERLIAGWCEVFFTRGGAVVSEYKEVSLDEYNQGQANWKTRPASMLNKVAISQCIREAFPEEFEGLYSEDEMVASGAIPADINLKEPDESVLSGGVVDVDYSAVEDDPVVTQEARMELFSKAKEYLGKEGSSAIVKQVLMDVTGRETTDGMKQSEYTEILKRIMVMALEKRSPDPIPEGSEDA